LCVGDDTTSDGVWTNGAILDATLTTSTSGVHYLRYDVDYSLTNNLNNSGTVIGVYFTGGTGDKAAGLVMGYDTGNLTNTIPAGRTLTLITNELALAGTLIAIAEVDLDNDTLKVWYSLDGSNPTNYATPAASTNTLGLTSITNLRFHATGDFRPAGSTDYASVDNIRHTIGDTGGGTAWDEIIEAVADLSAPPDLTISVTNSLNGAMDLYATNIVTVVISNQGASTASSVTSTLTNSGSASAFIITSNNTPPVALAPGESTTNTYDIVAIERGNYDIYVRATCSGTNYAQTSFSLASGANLSFLPETIAEPGGEFPGLYEPGETLNITITTTNDGATAVSNIINSLTPVSEGFSVSAQTSQNYASVLPNATTSTVYQIVIDAGVTNGTYFFNVTNHAGSLSWTTNFSFDVSIRQPNSDWVKANNSSNLNMAVSWVNELIPNSTDRAILDPTVTAAITTDLGSNLSWRGIALVSNTSPWTISGTNTLTTGSAGIDMSLAQANLTIASQLALATTQTWNVATSQTLTVSGELSGTNTAPLIKTGPGTVVLNGTNTYQGGTTVSNGTLSAGSDSAFGTGSLTIYNATVDNAVELTLANNITLSGNALLNNTAGLTLSGIISGSGSLTKSGSGTLSLKKENTYSGGTTNNGQIYIYSTQSLGTGDLVMNDGSVLESDAAAFSSNNSMNNDIVLNGDTSFKAITSSAGIINLSGDITGSGSMSFLGYNLRLFGNNTFSGGLNITSYNWIYFENGGLGTGPITSLRNDCLLRATQTATISNAIAMDFNVRFRVDSGTLTLAGPMSGGGILKFQDNTSTAVELPNANPGRTGATWLYTPTFRIGHEEALGSGEIDLMAYSYSGIEVSKDLTGVHSIANNVSVGGLVYDENGSPYSIKFNLDYDLELSGAFTSYFENEESGLVIEKNGLGSLILSGANSYAHHINVNAGSLVISNATFGSEAVTIASGAALNLQIAPVFTGDLTVEPAAQTTLFIHDDNSVLSGAGNLALAGTLTLDFENYSGANSPISSGDTFSVIDSNWSSITDNGLTVQAANLPPYMTIDDSNLFVDGTVTIIASRLSDQSLTITVPVGMTADGSITLTNDSGATLDFTFANNGSWPAGDYTVTTNQNIGRVSFQPVQFDSGITVFSNWNGTGTSPKDIDFDFGVFGTAYSTFSVNQNGTITLAASGVESALIQPFETTTAFTQSSIRYKQTSTNLVVAWGVTNPIGDDTGVLQAWLNTDGTIRYLYKYGTWGSGTIGIDGSRTQLISYTPGTISSGSLLLTPSSWITNDPEEGSIASGGSQVVTFTANAMNQPAGETSFTASTIWSDGETSALNITVIVTEEAPNLEVPNPFAFSGPVFTKAVMTVTNTGDADLTYTITDSGLQTNGYSFSSATDNWYNIPVAAPYILTAEELDTETIGLGFPFTFFGNTYSTAIVNQDGSISLGNGRTITPYSANLSFVDGVSSVRTFTDTGFERFVVIWQNMRQPDGSNQTFQAILNRDGTIQFNYQTMTGLWYDGTIQLSDPAETVTGTLINASTSTTETNYVRTIISIVTNSVTINGRTEILDITTNSVITGTNVVVTCNDTANRQSIVFTPGQSQVIYASPTTATVPAGETADVTICGDARSAGTGIYNTTLTFTYSGLSTNSSVTFTATNGVIDPSDIWGGDPAVFTQKNANNSYSISWQTPSDRSSRIYKIWYTTSLSTTWSNIATVTNNYRYVDSDPVRNAAPVIFYKVTVE
ncbi:MAG: autotransporter-associated beta strand repeat-containing protein, partial [Kiritimatiellales bacterium]